MSPAAQAAEAEAPPEAWEEMAGAMLCWKKGSSSVPKVFQA